MVELEDALVNHRSSHTKASEFAKVRKNRIESHIQSRLTQLEGCHTQDIYTFSINVLEEYYITLLICVYRSDFRIADKQR